MAKQLRRQLRRERRIAIRDGLAAIMRDLEPTPFAGEGPARAGVRARLCMAGWPWQAADAEAELLTRAALQVIGARRPSWRQGQPEHTQDGYAPFTRERCKRCAKPLPEGNYTFCGPVCRQAAKVDRNRQRDREELRIAEAAYKAAWSERQPEQKCAACERAFRPKRPGQTYCSYECYRITRRLARRNMPMVCEGF